MNKKIKYIVSIQALILLSFTSCKKYLSEEPRAEASIKTVEQLDAMIDNAALFTYDGGGTIGNDNNAGIWITDDTEIPIEAYRNLPSIVRIDYLYYYTFKPTEISSRASDAFYSGMYRQIFTANVILNNVDNVTGSQTSKDEIKANAHFIRAYCYWVLANQYCLPYGFGKNENANGLTIKRTTGYEESLRRSSLKDTYDFILQDLEESKKTSQDDIDPKKPWRVSKKAISAFLSRIYLFTGNYDQALNECNSALTSNSAQLVDFRTIKAGNSVDYSNPSVKLTYSELNSWTEAKFLYWKEFYIPRFTRNVAQWYMPSEDLISKYDKNNDLRYKWLMIENGGRKFSVVSPSLYQYTYFFDGRHIPTGPTVSEILLNKAEILARKGNISDALIEVNKLREKRMANSSPLIATNTETAIKVILEERRRELPFAMRWYDIRRFSINDYTGDDIKVKHKFFKVELGKVDMDQTLDYELPIGSLLYALPYNAVEIESSQGQIEQNKY